MVKKSLDESQISSTTDLSRADIRLVTATKEMEKLFELIGENDKVEVSRKQLGVFASIIKWARLTDSTKSASGGAKFSPDNANFVDGVDPRRGRAEDISVDIGGGQDAGDTNPRDR